MADNTGWVNISKILPMIFESVPNVWILFSESMIPYASRLMPSIFP